MKDLFERFEAYKEARESGVRSNPPDAPSEAIFRHFNDTVKFEDYLATLHDKGQEVDPDDVEIAARKMGMSGPALQGFLEGLAGWL